MADLAPIAAAVRERRMKLGLSQRAGATIAGVSGTTWQSFEKHHEPISDLTQAGMGRALRWPEDWLDQLVNGAEPDDLPTVEHVDVTDPVVAAIRELTDRIDGLERLIREADSSEGDQ